MCGLVKGRVSVTLLEIMWNEIKRKNVTRKKIALSDTKRLELVYLSFRDISKKSVLSMFFRELWEMLHPRMSQ